MPAAADAGQPSPMAATKQRLGFLVVTCFLIRVHGHPNYADALRKSILFFEGQRSGRLPGDQRITWRSNSGLSDGSAANVTSLFMLESMD